MPKIIAEKSKARFVAHVDTRVLEAYQDALKRASDVGLRVDVTRDVELMLRRLTRVISNAISEQISCAGDEKVNAPSDFDGERRNE